MPSYKMGKLWKFKLSEVDEWIKAGGAGFVELIQDKTPLERILSALGDETLSTTELMERLGLSHRPTFRKNYLNPALEQKLIVRTIPDKPNSKNQKYKKHQNLS